MESLEATEEPEVEAATVILVCGVLLSVVLALLFVGTTLAVVTLTAFIAAMYILRD